MAHYEVTSTHESHTVVLATTRRLNGALNIQAEHVASARAHLMEHAGPGGRVVEGPTGVEGEIAVSLIGPTAEQTIVYGVRRK